MALISALPVLDRPQRRVPPTAEAATTEGPLPSTESAEVELDSDPDREGDAPIAVRRTRRLPHPPGRRGPLWLAALVAGAVLAGIPSVLFGGSPVVNADASDYGLGIASDLGLSGGIDDAEGRRGITEAEAQQRLGELAASRAAREPKTVVPVTEFRLTTCFCMRWGQMHPGWDMAAPLGTPIYSAVDGVVLDAGPASGFGNAVYIQDEDGNVHIYGHMRYYDVEAGDVVRAGDQIAVVGNEGFSTGPHVHWQIHEGGRDGPPTDPQKFLAERGVPI